MNLWVVISESCHGCGGNLATLILDHEPTESEKRKCNDALGGMCCIVTRVVKADVNSVAIITQ